MYPVGGRGAPTVRYAPVVPWAKTGPANRIHEFVKFLEEQNVHVLFLQDP
jgi:hypothetical protein